MNLKDYHNNGSDVFEIIDMKTEKFICKVKVNRKKNFDLIQIENNVYMVSAIHTCPENVFEVNKLNFNFKPSILYHYNNVFHCPYCNRKYISDDDYGTCFMCRSKSKVDKIIFNISFPTCVDVFEQEQIDTIEVLARERKKFYINNKITPIRRARIMKCENIVKKHKPLKNQMTMKEILKRGVLDE